LIAGYVASKLSGQRHSLVKNLVVGVVGALLAHVLLWELGLQPVFMIEALVSATVGSVVLLFLLYIYDNG
jgi:uncharacterized membrane protein YeaQ/YmgE (transglycosylase-associated protein family)